MPKFQTFITSPFTLMALATLFTLGAFRVPEFADYLLGGAVITITQSFVSIAVLLAAVWLSRHARAAFSKGEPDATYAQAIIVSGAYLSCAMVISAVIEQTQAPR